MNILDSSEIATRFDALKKILPWKFDDLDDAIEVSFLRQVLLELTHPYIDMNRDDFITQKTHLGNCFVQEWSETLAHPSTSPPTYTPTAFCKTVISLSDSLPESTFEYVCGLLESIVGFLYRVCGLGATLLSPRSTPFDTPRSGVSQADYVGDADEDGTINALLWSVFLAWDHVGLGVVQYFEEENVIVRVRTNMAKFPDRDHTVNAVFVALYDAGSIAYPEFCTVIRAALGHREARATKEVILTVKERVTAGVASLREQVLAAVAPPFTPPTFGGATPSFDAALEELAALIAAEAGPLPLLGPRLRLNLESQIILSDVILARASSGELSEELFAYVAKANRSARLHFQQAMKVVADVPEDLSLEDITKSLLRRTNEAVASVRQIAKSRTASASNAGELITPFRQCTFGLSNVPGPSTLSVDPASKVQTFFQLSAVSGVPLTETMLRAEFDAYDTKRQGYLLKDDFVQQWSTKEPHSSLPFTTPNCVAQYLEEFNSLGSCSHLYKPSSHACWRLDLLQYLLLLAVLLSSVESSSLYY